MKRLLINTLAFCALFSLVVLGVNAQVGINTTNPNGILDVNSSTQGIVLPRVALTATNVALPVQNPQGGNLAPGTVVYNTSTTSTGTNDVNRGIYVWNGTEWYNKFTKKDATIVKQTSFFQPSSTAGYENVPNLTSKTFTPLYSGTYKIEVSVNFGSGYVANNNADDADVAAQEGNFRFTFNGTDYNIPAKANASLNTSGTRYYAIWEQFSVVEYIDLTAGTNYSYNLAFDLFDSPGFENNGASGDGLGYIGIPDHVPCSVEFTYIGN
ncbi:hypothetical protein ACFQO1_02655 [Jejudonia soesokkakensis]|uniref:PA14 domain-containing protein n=1 Tax=Jejudonia soesokkakensis TaxID=1323432 RepID=A0ABW2MQE0_9FLAO